MKKTLYSLMLSDDVVREVDRLAHRMGTNRSSLVNQILAEYVNCETPESRINDVFSAIEQLLAPQGVLVPFVVPNAATMSLKSSLEYKYRPTVKYEVQLHRPTGDSMGTLSVNFRTQSAALISAMTEFFRLYKRIEDIYLTPLLPGAPQFALYDGRLERSLSSAAAGRTADELAQAISGYISLFDKLLKSYVCGEATSSEVEAAYVRDLRKRPVLV